MELARPDNAAGARERPHVPPVKGEAQISVIIPVLNDAFALEGLLIQLSNMPHVHEIIVVDGGSQDDSLEVAERFGAVGMKADRGRGSQMNTGAFAATGEILWFLHADNQVDSNSTRSILRALSDEGVVGGAFQFRLTETRWFGPFFHFFINMRSRQLGLPYGDQGYFVRRGDFEQIGGFSVVPIMEDIDFIRRLSQTGPVAALDTPIGVSPRRWDEEGVFRRTLLNWWLVFRYFFGTSPGRLSHLYPSIRK